MLKNFLQHRLNSVHVYCRLCDCGLSKGKAKTLSKIYEKYFYKGVNYLLGLILV